MSTRPDPESSGAVEIDIILLLRPCFAKLVNYNPPCAITLINLVNLINLLNLITAIGGTNDGTAQLRQYQQLPFIR